MGPPLEEGADGLGRGFPEGVEDEGVEDDVGPAEVVARAEGRDRGDDDGGRAVRADAGDEPALEVTRDLGLVTLAVVTKPPLG